MRKLCFLLSMFLDKALWAQMMEPKTPSPAVHEQTIDGVHYVFYRANPSNVALHWKDNEGKAYQQLGALKKHLERQGKSVQMLMNAGIYSENLTPAGLWVEEGRELKALNVQKGSGNFHMEPNGVFSIENGEAFIRTTHDYRKSRAKPQFAVQSGPMLVINGAINPRFKPENGHGYKRNAVCVTGLGELWFVMTTHYQKRWPNLYELASALQRQGCENALYLDGSISSWYVPHYANSFHWSEFVGMISVTE